MRKTINRRLEDLEGNDNPQAHEYNAVIEWIEDSIESHYYRDGIEISEAQFFREAPKDIKRSVDWGNPAQPKELNND